MTKINLLPWREIKRKQEKKSFILLLLSSFFVAVCVVFFINQYASSLVGEQTTRNQRLQGEINWLNARIVEIKKLKLLREGLMSRMNIVHNLLMTRTLAVHLFDELIKVLPEGIYLTSIKRTADKVNVQGYSESNSHVSILMRNIQQNAWIHAPVLTDIKKSEGKTEASSNEFHLGFILKPQYQRVAIS